MECITIGTIHSPFTELEGMPIQPAGAAGVKGTVEVLPDYSDGLQDVAGFSHLILLYAFHRSRGFDLRVVPFMDGTSRGVFATRAPRRPNPIGLSVVRMVRVEGRVLHVENVDVIDGTPLLDIKPYVPGFDPSGEIRIGWLAEAGHAVAAARADSRFTQAREQADRADYQ
jgi:tRNA-Thr(GGU) m(6)t(6)A37 methyltransferase TsaA